MSLDPTQFTDSRFAQLLGDAGAAKLATNALPFFTRQRGPEETARLFSCAVAVLFAHWKRTGKSAVPPRAIVA